LYGFDARYRVVTKLVTGLFVQSGGATNSVRCTVRIDHALLRAARHKGEWRVLASYRLCGVALIFEFDTKTGLAMLPMTEAS
jgi:hypothetical protein